MTDLSNTTDAVPAQGVRINPTFPHPTPTHIRVCILDALIADANDPHTPHVPVHVMPLIRAAIAEACRQHDAEWGLPT